MSTGGGDLVYQRREIRGWNVPTVEFADPARDTLCLHVSGEVVNEFTDNTAKKQNWKVQVASEVKTARGGSPWNPNRSYAISLSPRFYPGRHGGYSQNLDVENYIKPIIDAIAAGLFCLPQEEPRNINYWNYNDSNFNTLLIHRLADADSPDKEGVAVFVSAR